MVEPGDRPLREKLEATQAELKAEKQRSEKLRVEIGRLAGEADEARAELERTNLALQAAGAAATGRFLDERGQRAAAWSSDKLRCEILKEGQKLEIILFLAKLGREQLLTVCNDSEAKAYLIWHWVEEAASEE